MKEFNLGDKVFVPNNPSCHKTGYIVSKRKLKVYHGTLINYDVQLKHSNVKLIELDTFNLTKI